MEKQYLKLYRTKLDENRYPVLVSDSGIVCDDVVLEDSDVLFNFCTKYLDIQNEAEEYVYCFAVNNRLKCLGVFEVSHGNAVHSNVSVRNVFQRLLLIGAQGFFFVHNHPSGNCNPSESDIELTDRLKQAGDLMGVQLMDHLIIGYNRYYSFTSVEQKKGKTNGIL